MYAPPLRYKREALAQALKLTQTHTELRFSGTQLHNKSNTTDSGRRVLHSGGPNHSKPGVFIVFLSEIELGLANPRVHILWAYAGAFRHPTVGTLKSPRHLAPTMGAVQALARSPSF